MKAGLSIKGQIAKHKAIFAGIFVFVGAFTVTLIAARMNNPVGESYAAESISTATTPSSVKLKAPR